ncbi:hypothetical protein KFK09_028672 [Dendrobium nobile]|uniref:Uncharacterized protein n=1 Tax=Dendrobium nobile TaxID=94219 RepID=A0A8T3A8A6_DENNO|nr:hypothetical protein KFK09_028672 [Dendrobium nobile]
MLGWMQAKHMLGLMAAWNTHWSFPNTRSYRLITSNAHRILAFIQNNLALGDYNFVSACCREQSLLLAETAWWGNGSWEGAKRKKGDGKMIKLLLRICLA